MYYFLEILIILDRFIITELYKMLSNKVDKFDIIAWIVFDIFATMSNWYLVALVCHPVTLDLNLIIVVMILIKTVSA